MATPNASSTASQNDPMTSLYVGDLHPDVTESMLFDKFASAGPLLSIRVCRDVTTRQSLGCAYVNFQYPADAERALDTMNFDVLLDRSMRIIWSQRDPALRKSGVGSIFIDNLDNSIDDKTLYNKFSVFGNIFACKIIRDENGQSKGFGFVHFETQEAADEAIERGNGMLLAKKKVSVDQYIPSIQCTDAQGQKKYANIFIKNFDGQLDEEQLRELLFNYGNIVTLIILYDEDGHSRGFGFCSFEDPEDAKAAVQHLNGYQIGDKQLFVGRVQKKAERMAEIKRKKDARRLEQLSEHHGENLYIKNLDANIDDERLKKEFSKFGTVTSARVVTENGQSKGTGFVCFTTPDEATKAITEMNGSILGTKPLYVALVQRKEERRANLTNQHMQRLPTSPRHFVPQTAMPAYQPYSSFAVNTGEIRPQEGVPLQQTTTLTDTTRYMPTIYPVAFPSSIVVPGQEPLIPAVLDNATPQEQKQMLGKSLFPLIQQIQPALAGKITGMILEIDNNEILHMLESRESLRSKVEEAVAVLQAHQAKQIYAAKLAETNSSSS